MVQKLYFIATLKSSIMILSRLCTIYDSSLDVIASIGLCSDICKQKQTNKNKQTKINKQTNKPNKNKIMCLLPRL